MVAAQRPVQVPESLRIPPYANSVVVHVSERDAILSFHLRMPEEGGEHVTDYLVQRVIISRALAEDLRDLLDRILRETEPAEEVSEEEDQ